MATVPAITCPGCKKSFKGNPSLIGKKIRCPSCTTPFVVPGPEEEDIVVTEAVEDDPSSQAVAAGTPKGAPPPKKQKASFSFDDEEEGPDEYGVTDIDLTPRCPHCANPLESAQAVVCLYCGYNTMSRTFGETKKVYEHTFEDYMIHLWPGLACVGTIFLLSVFCLWYCLVMPYYPPDNWEWATYEAVRLWVVILSLFSFFPLGYFAYQRLIINFVPPEKEKE